MAILIDDLPWADECSLRFLVYLAERLDDLPVALIVTVRAGDPGEYPPSFGSAATKIVIPSSTRPWTARGTVLTTPSGNRVIRVRNRSTAAIRRLMTAGGPPSPYSSGPRAKQATKTRSM
jgi:hypothetical protein